jgi:hypothetical protein
VTVQQQDGRPVALSVADAQHRPAHVDPLIGEAREHHPILASGTARRRTTG